ncbi:PREDICTED: interferon-inducible GTPase 5 isoform X2 [Colobus angolensis palliatus]|uniref:IRG-type G domain-containing protein n=3 Tax=Colobus angolensis palliatus TaxID=336983 RepID=A0A2K5HJI6_COLAP|nr:PREDICTED: interferon-inducible GTPase 5 isoform X2 [Colobus angolensis palliatus]XP_011818492.1 PREDICTED: interferon-inducible GTPase 5 isoform X2 [Colobus angolensis palliatus]XP_011818493.1 PREDICTED: interferon-inducible GTPase 5 isoform X2 [Colobus angolensis palliatus]
MATSKLPVVPGEEETTILMAKERLEALRTAFESGNLPQAASHLQELLASTESTRLEVGVTGESGAGKSSLINVLRGLGAEDPGAALTGVVETTMQPSSYPHPQFPDVTLWDLPGAGSPGCPVDKYLKQVDFSRYDFFLLVSSRCCGAVETRLAAEVLCQGKKFYFVRTKVDEDLWATRTQRPSGFREAAVLQEIRDHCAERLREAGVAEPRIFLVSNLSPARYDFPTLVSTWEHDLPAHRRRAGLLSLPDISLEALQKKKAMLQEQVLKTALVLGVIQALPVPGLAAAYDYALLIHSLRGYHRSFGLDDDSLAKLAEQVGKQAGDLRSVIRSPLANEVSPENVLRLYSQSSDGAMRVARAFERGIPVFGTLVAGGISFGAVYTMLQGCLNEMAEDAQRVRIKALEEDQSQPEVSLEAASDNGVEKGGSGEGGSEEAPLSTRRKLGLLLKYILDSWKKHDSEEK